MLRFLVFTSLTDRYNSTHREFCQVLMTSLQGGSPQLLYPLLTWVKKSINDSYDHLGCIQVLIISQQTNYLEVYEIPMQEFCSGKIRFIAYLLVFRLPLELVWLK